MSDLLSLYETLKSKKWVDLSHVINESSPHFPALPALEKEDLFTLKDGFHVQKISVVGQYGTPLTLQSTSWQAAAGWIRLSSRTCSCLSMLLTSRLKWRRILTTF